MKYLLQCPNRSVPRILNCSLKKKKRKKIKGKELELIKELKKIKTKELTKEPKN